MILNGITNELDILDVQEKRAEQIEHSPKSWQLHSILSKEDFQKAQENATENELNIIQDTLDLLLNEALNRFLI